MRLDLKYTVLSGSRLQMIWNDGSTKDVYYYAERELKDAFETTLTTSYWASRGLEARLGVGYQTAGVELEGLAVDLVDTPLYIVNVGFYFDLGELTPSNPTPSNPWMQSWGLDFALGIEVGGARAAVLPQPL